MADLEEAFNRVASKFGIQALNSHQQLAISKLIERKNDIFVNLPTGSGKSLIFQALPLVIDHVSSQPGHICVVVSPLLTLVDDQVEYLRGKGVTAASISSCTEEEATVIEKGKISVVFGSPEAWIQNERWRSMLGNSVYSKKLCALAIDEAHVIRQWGTSQSNKMAAFRHCYGKLYELRSLAPNTPMVALTATATKLTEDTIKKVLLMQNPLDIKESPNKVNLTYSVIKMNKDCDLELFFEWLVEDIRKLKDKCDRTIIYCQTIKQCGIIYGMLRGLLRKDLFIEKTSTGEKLPLVEMLHSCTPATNKKNILSSFQHEDGIIRVLVATIAFGMGVNCKAVHRIIHYGPSKNIEAFVQETGRAGRDGHQSNSFLLYHGMLLNHVEGDIKLFIKSTDCRRKAILEHFNNDNERPLLKHLCCDNCANNCDCGLPECKTSLQYPVSVDAKSSSSSSRKRDIQPLQREHVKKCLIKYHKSLLVDFVGMAANANLKTLTNIQFMLGFGDLQISQVLHNLEHIFEMSDVYRTVEIWHKRHAQEIIRVIGETFHDTNVNSNDAYAVDDDDDDDNNVVFSEDLLDEWSDILLDDELFEMVMDNISLSQMDTSSYLANQPNDSCDVDIVDDDNDLFTALAGTYGV
ncbi:uncharacterized protein [Montipora foliosa]|uniref:uncharacterized protein n=1 Tax=Montipora foliosa TaxID=591990 RepID=UPI0035F10646